MLSVSFSSQAPLCTQRRLNNMAPSAPRVCTPYDARFGSTALKPAQPVTADFRGTAFEVKDNHWAVAPKGTALFAQGMTYDRALVVSDGRKHLVAHLNAGTPQAAIERMLYTAESTEGLKVRNASYSVMRGQGFITNNTPGAPARTVEDEIEDAVKNVTRGQRTVAYFSNVDPRQPDPTDNGRPAMWPALVVSSEHGLAAPNTVNPGPWNTGPRQNEVYTPPSRRPNP